MKKSNNCSIITFEKVSFYFEKGFKKIETLFEESYGPYGKNILLDAKNRTDPELFKNGSKIIKNLRTKNELENILFLILEDAFQKVNSVSGDGTKTFFLITCYLVLNGFKNIIQNASSLEIKSGITKTINYALKILNDKSLPIDTKDFWNIILERYIPEDNNLIEIFQEAFEKIGKSGHIKISSQTGKKSSLKIERGMKINKGYFSPYFTTDNKKMITFFENPYLLITTQKINMEDSYLIKLLEPIIYEKKPLLIISPDIDEQLLSTLILNKVNGILDVCYIKIPQTFFYDKSLLEDLALYTNARLISSRRDWKLLQYSDLGQAEKIIVTKTKSIFWAKTNFQESLIEKKCQELKEQIFYSNSDYENEKREGRRKNFTGANATVEIGGITDLEISDLYLRAETGLLAAKSCLYEGVLPASSISFVQLIEELENWSRANLHGSKANGSKLFINALIKPLQSLFSQQKSIRNLNNSSFLKNFEKIKNMKDIFSSYELKKEKIVNLKEAGILDSFKSIRIGLQTATSLTYSILSIATIILS